MKGILFKPEMIQAIIEGRKTQTRRLGGLKKINLEPDNWILGGWDNGYEAFVFYKQPAGGEKRIVKPRYQVGETVYVKEAYCFPIPMDNLSPMEIYYKYGAFHRRYLLDGIVRGGNPFSLTMIDGRVRSPMMMPEWAARYFITR